MWKFGHKLLSDVSFLQQLNENYDHQKPQKENQFIDEEFSCATKQ